MSEASRAVFLSYASQDAEAAKKICDALRSGGVEVWFDADGGLEHGDEWDAKIRRQIKECVFFVPLISANTQARLEGYFRIEWDLAAERARGVAAGVPFILPVVIDDTREPDALVPDRFRKVQWTRIPGGMVPPDVQSRLLKLWSHRVGVLAHDDGRTRGPGYAPPVSSPLAPGETRAPGFGDPAEGATAFGGRRLAAIVFTDVVGYSARMQTDEASTLALAQSDIEQMRRQCAQHGGSVLKSTGDGLLLCFDSVVDAVTCALAIQTGFAGRGGGALQHRIGVHVGDVYHQAGDVAGDGVNLAARLQGAAQPGTICVSDAVFDAVKGKVAMASVALAPLVLKNIAQPRAAHLIAPIGTRLAAGAGARGARGRRAWTIAAVGVAMLAGVAAFFFQRPQKPAAPVASNAVPAAEFPRDPNLKRARALIFAVDSIAGDFALADDLVKPLLAAQPNDPEVVIVAAEVSAEYLVRGFDQTPPRRAQAQRLGERAVQLAPDNPAALAALGRYLRSAKTQLGRAEELLRRAVALDPKESRLYRELYSVLILTKPGPDTAAFGARMAALFPHDPMVTYEIAVLHMTVGDLAAAEEGFDQTLKLAPVANAITSKARLMLEVHGDVEGMKLWLDRMPARQRTNARLANAYAVVALVTGQTAPARQVLDAITDTWLADGTYIFPRAMLIGDLEAINRHDDLARLSYEAALDEINRALAADPTDLRPHRAELWVQLALGHRQEALAELRVNLQKRPNPYRWTINLTWWTGSLRACLLLGERAEAMTQLREACAEAQGRLLLRNLFKVDPKMAPFRDDPEIVALLAEPEAKKSTAAPVLSPSNGSLAVDDKSVAVLAFANLSDDKGSEYFSDGISEELLNVLAKVPGLKVTARTSSFYFKGKNLPIPEIAAKLGVAYVIEGSVQRAGDSVRITAQLIKAADGFHVWSDHFDRELKNVFALQDEIAGLIAKNLSLKLGTSSAAATASVNPAAFELYLQGRELLNRRDASNRARAEDLFNRALVLEPNLARAHAALAETWLWLGGMVTHSIGRFDQRDSPEPARIFAKARQAIALDPDSAEAHTSLGMSFLFGWNQAEAEQEFRRAIALNPNFAQAHNWLGQALMDEGRMDEALAEMTLASQLDPLSQLIVEMRGRGLDVAGRRTEAIAVYDQALSMSDSLAALAHKGYALAELGRTDEAVAVARRLPAGDPVMALAQLRIFASVARRTEAEAFQSKTDAHPAYVLLLLGRPNEALAALNAQTVNRNELHDWLFEPWIDPIRHEPRFAQFLATLGATEAHARAQAWRKAHPPEKPAATK